MKRSKNTSFPFKRQIEKAAIKLDRHIHSFIHKGKSKKKMNKKKSKLKNVL